MPSDYTLPVFDTVSIAGWHPFFEGTCSFHRQDGSNWALVDTSAEIKCIKVFIAQFSKILMTNQKLEDVRGENKMS
jgi:hypothetical protein